jgi:hypothetical protein
MPRILIGRPEMLEAELVFGRTTVALADYVTTGLVSVAVGPPGAGKTTAGLVIAEQLAEQGWVSVLIDPEGELEGLYGNCVASPDELRERLTHRDVPIVVVKARDAAEFVPYGRVIFEVADAVRKAMFVMVDEGQLFSVSRCNAEEVVEATNIVNELVGRGRKRALDVFITAHRFTGTLQRMVFAAKNLTFVGRLEDHTAWSSLAPQFRAAKIDYQDLSALGTGEFFCISRTGIEKIRMPMAQALEGVAPKARQVRRPLPSGFREWSRAMKEIPTPRLKRLTPEIIALLSTVAGLPGHQVATGARALQDELESRR